VDRLARQLWQQIPAATARVWPTGAAALSDGAYLRRWPGLALALPAAGLLLGMVLGAAHPGPIYSYSFAVTAAMAAAATMGAGMGLWILFGYVCADLAFSDRSSLPGFGTYTAARLTQALVPLAMSYLVLGLLLVVIPLAANGFAVQATAALRRARAGLAMLASCAVYVGVAAALGYAWAQAMPFMIRPLWSFAGQTPDTAAVQPIQGNVSALCAIVAAAAVVRCLLTGFGTGFSAWPSPARAGTLPTRGRRAVLRTLAWVPTLALIVTLLLGGLIGTIWQGAVIFALLCVVLAARLVIIPLIPRYPEAVSRVPVLVRIGLCALIGYWLGGAIVQPAVDNSETSFTPLLVAILGSLAAAALLLPGSAWKRGAGRAYAGRSPDRPGSPPPPEDFGKPQWRPGYPAPAEPTRPSGLNFTGRQLLRLGRVLVVILVVQMLLPAPSALADNCGDLSDCSTGIKIALVVAAIVGITILVVLLPEIVAPVIEPLAGAVSAEEAAAAATAAGLDAAFIASEAGSEVVSAEATIAAGTVGPKLGSILSAMQSAFEASSPTSAFDAISAVSQAVANIGYELGTRIGLTAAGSMVFQQFGGVNTFIFANGQVLVVRGPQVLLNLIPK
jgi:hypothetical protein